MKINRRRSSLSQEGQRLLADLGRTVVGSGIEIKHPRLIKGVELHPIKLKVTRDFESAGKLLGTTNRVIAERPQELKKVIKGLVKGSRFVRDNRDESIRILADWGRAQKEDAANAYDSSRQVFSPDGSMIEEGMRLVIEDAKKALKVTRPVTLTEVSDTGALREAQRELGLKSR